MPDLAMINKKYVWYALWPALFGSGCASAPETPALPEVQQYSGLIRFDKGFCNFTDCANGRIYLLADSTRTIGPLHHRACQPAQCPGETVFAMVEGRLFPGVGNPKNDPGVLAVVKVDSLTAKNKFNCCIPYEFWCSGTEPFWSLQISKEEKSCFFKDIGRDEGLTFEWSAPTIQDGVYHYRCKNRQNPAVVLEATIRQGVCNDGMSDLSFAYAAVVKLNGREYRGCAVRWGQNIPQE